MVYNGYQLCTDCCAPSTPLSHLLSLFVSRTLLQARLTFNLTFFLSSRQLNISHTHPLSIDPLSLPVPVYWVRHIYPLKPLGWHQRVPNHGLIQLQGVANSPSTSSIRYSSGWQPVILLHRYHHHPITVLITLTLPGICPEISRVKLYFTCVCLKFRLIPASMRYAPC